MLVVSSNSGGLVGTTREHLGYALALEVPIFFVVSKLDLCVGGRETVEATIKQLESILTSPGVKKVPIVFFRGRHFNCHLTFGYLHALSLLLLYSPSFHLTIPPFTTLSCLSL